MIEPAEQDEILDKRDKAVEAGGNNVPRNADGLRDFLIKHVAHSMNSSAPDKEEALEVSDRQQEQAATLRKDAGTAKVDRLALLARWRNVSPDALLEEAAKYRATLPPKPKRKATAKPPPV